MPRSTPLHFNADAASRNTSSLQEGAADAAIQDTPSLREGEADVAIQMVLKKCIFDSLDCFASLAMTALPTWQSRWVKQNASLTRWIASLRSQ